MCDRVSFYFTGDLGKVRVTKQRAYKFLEFEEGRQSSGCGALTSPPPPPLFTVS